MFYYCIMSFAFNIYVFYKTCNWIIAVCLRDMARIIHVYKGLQYHLPDLAMSPFYAWTMIPSKLFWSHHFINGCTFITLSSLWAHKFTRPPRTYKRMLPRHIILLHTSHFPWSYLFDCTSVKKPNLCVSLWIESFLQPCGLELMHCSHR